MQGLAGKSVVMTGATGGIGSFLASMLVADGATVYAISRSKPVLDAIKWCQADLATPSGLERAQSFVETLRPHILVNLAGTQWFGAFEDEPVPKIVETYLLNAIAPAVLCRACIPGMRERNDGQMINVGSILGSLGLANFASYSSSKGALKLLSEALRRELAGTGITVTHIAPRAVRTAMITNALERYAKATRMRLDQPHFVAERIRASIFRREQEVFIGKQERLFTLVNGLLPRVVDRVLARQDRLTRKLARAAE